ncbi:hypothetical protein STHE1630_01004 [Streptococcus thermophilus CNCM I-1630]|nr:hypothetical protein STHE1630_01004 [Streptococcus thermophilus CNCM I-1630]
MSETYDMNWYDTLSLVKKDSREPPDYVKRMQVQLEQAQAQKLGGDSALTETEKKILKLLNLENLLITYRVLRVQAGL